MRASGAASGVWARLGAKAKWCVHSIEHDMRVGARLVRHARRYAVDGVDCRLHRSNLHAERFKSGFTVDVAWARPTADRASWDCRTGIWYEHAFFTQPMTPTVRRSMTTSTYLYQCRVHAATGDGPPGAAVRRLQHGFGPDDRQKIKKARAANSRWTWNNVSV